MVEPTRTDPLTLLSPEGIRLGCTASDRFDAVQQAGELLYALGAVEEGYVPAMAERERMMSSFVGEGFALPHGTDAARSLVRRATLAFLQYPDGIEWEGERVHVCVAIAATGDEHVGVMSSLAQILLDPDQAEALRTAADPDTVLTLLTPDPDDEDT
jgi:mannitol/fructose-specific phosphotransferase system IIA component